MPKLSQGGLVALELLGIAEPARGVEKGDAAMAELEKMRDGVEGAAPVVDRHGVDAGVAIVAKSDHGKVRFAERQDVLEPVVIGRVDEDAVDLARAEDVERADLVLANVVAGGEHQRVAVRVELALDRARGKSERRVHDIGQDQADGLGRPADERAGDMIGQIVEALGGREDEVPRLLGDSQAAAKRQRHGVDGEAGRRGDILQPGA